MVLKDRCIYDPIGMTIGMIYYNALAERLTQYNYSIEP